MVEIGLLMSMKGESHFWWQKYTCGRYDVGSSKTNKMFDRYETIVYFCTLHCSVQVTDGAFLEENSKKKLTFYV